MNQVSRLVIAVAGCVLLAVGTAGPAVAHATLVRSNPAEGAVLAAAPAKAVFVFDEAVSLPTQGVRVFDADGDTLVASATSQDSVVTVDLPDRMASGTYVVTWRALSGDGHPIAGSLTFSIGRPSVTVAAPEPADAESPKVSATLSAVQGVGYLGLFLAAGLTVFAGTLLPRTIATGRSRTRIQGLAKISAVVALVATALTIPLTVILQQGLGLERIADRDTWLAGSPSAMAGLVLLAVGFTLLGQNVGNAADRRTRWFALSGVALVVIVPALTGHTRAFSPEPLVVGTDILHVLAGSVWLGGLVGIALTLPALAGREDDAAQTLARFSMAAAGVLVALTGTGLVLAWRILASWENLFGSTYGRILMVKLAVVLVVVAVAGWNRFVLLPRVRGVGGRRGRRGTAAKSTARIGATVRVEAAFLVIALLLTGFLVGRSPTATAADERPAVQTAELGDLVVRATMAPGIRGRNTVRIQITDPAGAPVELARPPAVRVRSNDLDLGTMPVASAGVGTCIADVVIPAAGRMEIQVSLRRTKFENHVATLTFRIAGT